MSRRNLPQRRRRGALGTALLHLFHAELDQRLLEIEQFTRVHWPIYIPTRGRPNAHLTTRELDAANLDYRLVVEPRERDAYAQHHDPRRLLLLDANDQGIAYARNWIKRHAILSRSTYHWQIDDDTQSFLLRRDGKPHRISARQALAVIEEVVDNCTNIGAACPSAAAYAFSYDGRAPIRYNGIVYGCALLRSEAPYAYRGDVPEDCDSTLQILESGEVTMVFKRVVVQTVATGSARGGNTETAYRGDGRLERYQRIAAAWPGLWTIANQQGRPRLTPTPAWRRYSQRPRLRPGASLLGRADGIGKPAPS
jgi:hypothetical protein